MRRFLLFICVAALLSGCTRLQNRYFPDPIDRIDLPPPAPLQVARPLFAVLEDETVLVEMADGTICRAAAGGSFAAGGWSGRLTECPYAYPYEVRLAASVLPGQVPLAPRPEAQQPASQTTVPFRPLVVLRVTDAARRSYEFWSEEGF
ncbi:hypothetical protein [Litoreibacter roseus]|uniref:Lipoprotein n=1 Tax=Litoreibacter roseus TaxID=2601869 RepID=A0A6N6JKE0_9RHOB|nr:hypothetical protein [Litoreibacter roseus]GFE65662.1 hypothetical protein KIN_27360 [Litoreibacter roseus]